LDKSTNYHITVYGRVQGVGFRAFTLRAANSLDLKGFVKNNSDGTVFIEAEGNESNLLKLISICKSGPGWAYVERVDYTEFPTRSHSGFRVKY